MKIIHIRIWWNVIFSLVMIFLSIDLFIQPDSIIGTNLGNYEPVRLILDSIGTIPVAILLFLAGIYFLLDAIISYRKIKNND